MESRPAVTGETLAMLLRELHVELMTTRCHGCLMLLNSFSKCIEMLSCLGSEELHGHRTI